MYVYMQVGSAEALLVWLGQCSSTVPSHTVSVRSTTVHCTLVVRTDTYYWFTLHGTPVSEVKYDLRN